MVMALNLGAAPAEGDVVTWADQKYFVEKVTSFTHKGERFAELTWRTYCPECGAAVRFRTGLKHKWFPKRCKIHNKNGEDAAERRVYVKTAWGDRMRAAKAERALAAGGEAALAPAIEDATLIRGGSVMRLTLVFSGGRRIDFDYAPGMEVEADEDSGALQAAMPDLAKEFDRLTAHALMG